MEIAQTQTERELIAIFSVRDSTGGWYNYYLQPLGFSPEAMEESQGETQLFVYELETDSLNSVPRIAIAVIPEGDIAFSEFEDWILPIQSNDYKLKGANRINNLIKDDFHCSQYDIVVPGGSACWIGGCTEYEPIFGCVAESGGDGSGGESSSGSYNWPTSGSNGGGGSSNDGSSSSSCPPPYSCGNPDEAPIEDDNQDIDISNLIPELIFLGSIEIDITVIDDAKVKCILNNLLNNGNTLAETILKFADQSINLDLKIELIEVEGNDPGSLVSSSSSNIFRLQIDKSRAQDRLPIQVAVTIMHEAIHAEMRRFLYSNPGTSTLSGFPGTFAEDWMMYINAQNGNDFEEQLSNAEHNAMAQEYLDVIISGLQDFDGNSLSYEQYYALAIEGLWESDLYQNINSNYNSWSEYNSAKNSAIGASNQNCTN